MIIIISKKMRIRIILRRTTRINPKKLTRLVRVARVRRIARTE